MYQRRDVHLNAHAEGCGDTFPDFKLNSSYKEMKVCDLTSHPFNFHSLRRRFMHRLVFCYCNKQDMQMALFEALHCKVQQPAI